MLNIESFADKPLAELKDKSALVDFFFFGEDCKYYRII